MNLTLYVLLASFAIFLLALAISLLASRKSLPKMIVKLSLLVFSMIMGIVLSTVMWKSASPTILAEVEKQAEQIADIANASPALEAYVTNLAGALAKPLLFWLLFIIVNIVSTIIASIVFLIIRIVKGKKSVENKPNKAVRIVKPILGVLCALVFCYSFMLPFVTYLNLAGKVADVTVENNLAGNFSKSAEEGEVAKNDSITGNETADMFIREARKYSANKLAKFHYYTSVPLINTVTSFKDQAGNKTTLFKEINVWAGVIPSAMKLKDVNFSDIEHIDVSPINELIDKVGESANIKTVLAEILSAASTKWTQGQSFMGFNLKESLSGTEMKDIEPAIDAILEDFKVTTSATVVSDVKDLVSAFQSISQVVSSVKDIDFSDIANIDTSKLDEAIDAVDQSAKLKRVFAVIIESAGEKWGNNESFCGISLISAETADLQNALNVIFNKFASTTETTVIADLRSFISTIDVLGEVYSSIESLDLSDPQNLDVAVFDNVVDMLGSDELVVEVTSVILNDAGTKWGAKDTFLGVNFFDTLTTQGGNQVATDAIWNSIVPAFDKFSKTTEATCISDLHAFSGTLRAIKYMQALASDEAGGATLNENMEDFLSAITPDTVDFLKDAITPDLLETVGFTSENAGVVSDILSSAIGAVGNMTDEEKVKEAEALNGLMSYVSGSNSGTSAEEVNPEDVVGNIVGSDALSGAIKEYAAGQTAGEVVLAEEDKQALGNALDSYTPASQEEQETVDALKKLFGIGA